MTKKWQKKAKIFLSEQKNGKNFRSGSELQVLALPVLRECMRSGRTVAAGDDLPRSFVLTDDRLVFTHISTSALKSRAEGE